MLVIVTGNHKIKCGANKSYKQRNNSNYAFLTEVFLLNVYRFGNSFYYRFHNLNFLYKQF